MNQSSQEYVYAPRHSNWSGRLQAKTHLQHNMLPADVMSEEKDTDFEL